MEIKHSEHSARRTIVPPSSPRAEFGLLTDPEVSAAVVLQSDDVRPISSILWPFEPSPTILEQVETIILADAGNVSGYQFLAYSQDEKVGIHPRGGDMARYPSRFYYDIVRAFVPEQNVHFDRYSALVRDLERAVGEVNPEARAELVDHVGLQPHRRLSMDRVLAMRARRGIEIVDQETMAIEPRLLWRQEVSVNDAQYAVEYYLWPAFEDLLLPAVLYLPVTEDEQPVPLVLSPLGCGEKIGSHNNTTSVQRRLSNIALRGMAAFSMVGFCGNGMFPSGRSRGNYRQHSALLYFAGERSIHSLQYDIWIRAAEWLSRNPGIDERRLGAVGYSNGAVISRELARVIPNVRAAAIVATPLGSQNALFYHPLDIRWLYVLGRDDDITSSDEAELAVRELGSVAEMTGDHAPRLEIVAGKHNFDRHRRVLTADWLQDVLGGRSIVSATRNREIETPLLDFKLGLQDILTETELRDIFVAITDRQDSTSQSGSPCNQTSQSDCLQQAFDVLGYESDAVPQAASYMVNNTRFESDGQRLDYRGWLVEYVPGLRSFVPELAQIGTEQPIETVGVIVSTERYFANEELARQALENGPVFSVILPGYGPMRSIQRTTGNLARALSVNPSTPSLAALSIHNIRAVVDLIQARYPEAEVVITSVGVEAGFASLLATAADDHIAQLNEISTLESYDQLVHAETDPIVPPIMLVDGLYRTMELPEIRRSLGPERSKVESLSDLSEFSAAQ